MSWSTHDLRGYNPSPSSCPPTEPSNGIRSTTSLRFICSVKFFFFGGGEIELRLPSGRIKASMAAFCCCWLYLLDRCEGRQVVHSLRRNGFDLTCCLARETFRLSAEDCCPLFRRITNTITYKAFKFVDPTVRPVEEEMTIFIQLGWTQVSTTICTRLPPYPFLLQCVVARVWCVAFQAYPLPLAQWVPWPLLSSLMLLSIVYISWTNTLISQCDYTISLPWQFHHHHHPYRKYTLEKVPKPSYLMCARP
jgi:hypothetical protein